MKFNKSTVYKIISLIIIILTFLWFWNYSDTLNIELFNKELTLSLSLYSSCIFIIGYVASYFMTRSFGERYIRKSKEYEKKISSTSVDSDKDKLRIEALERKIETLEKALKSTLEEK